MKLLKSLIIFSVAISLAYAATQGANVACGSSGSCTGCIPQGGNVSLWTNVGGASNCAIVDCTSAVPVASFNANVCASCNGQTGNVNGTGTIYNPALGTCAADCTGTPKTAANASNICVCNDPQAAPLSKSQTTCQCAAGYFGSTSSTTTTTCIQCPSSGATATTTANSAPSCCAVNYYGTSTCTACPAGSTAAVNTATALSGCSCTDKNASMINQVCTCAAGYYGSGAAGCTSCPSPGTGVQAPGSAGNVASCCAANYYGTTTCTACPTSSTANLNSAATVSGCTCADPNATAITSGCVCSKNYYGTASTTSTTGCTQCPAAGTGVSVPNSPGNISSCCAANYYGTTSCTACPSNQTATANTATTAAGCTFSKSVSFIAATLLLVLALL